MNLLLILLIWTVLFLLVLWLNPDGGWGDPPPPMDP